MSAVPDLPEAAVSVIVATRRRPELLQRCVDALLGQSGPHPFEVVLVNDDSDPLPSLPRDPRIRVVAGPQRGVAAARNVGVATATAPLLAFTDDDTIPAADWVQQMVQAAADHPEAAVLDGPVVVGPTDPLHFHAPDARPGGCCTANAVYRRDAFEAAGGFDERFTGWMPEDVDLGRRVARVASVVYVASMVVAHPPRPITIRERMQQAANVEGPWLLFRKHPSLSRWRAPLRWVPAIASLRYWLRLLADPRVVRASPPRALRILVLALSTTTVAAVESWRRWPGPA